MIKINFISGTKAVSADINQNFIDLLNLNIYNETPDGSIDSLNVNFTTAFKFKFTTLRVYLSKPTTSESPTEFVDIGMVRLQPGVDYIEQDPDNDGNGDGFQMTLRPATGTALIVDYQRSNILGNF